MSAHLAREVPDDDHADLDAGRDVAVDANQYAVHDGESSASRSQPEQTSTLADVRERLSAITALGDDQLPPPPSLRVQEPSFKQDEETSYAPVSTDELLPPPGFRPFFTIVEDPETGEHYHPSVHYLFSDDEDQEVLTSAAINAVHDIEAFGNQDATYDEEERVVVVDVDADGHSITRAVSMSPHWQAVKTDVTQAPSWGDTAKNTEGSFMLKITGKEGRNIFHRGTEPNYGLDELVGMFNQQLDSLNEVLGETEDSVGVDERQLSESQNDNDQN